MLTVSKQSVLLQAFRWFKRRQHAFSDGFGETVTTDIGKTEAEGARINACPIIRTVFGWGPFLILPGWLAMFVVLPTLLVVSILAALALVGLLILGGYESLAMVPEFDVIAALQVAGVIAGILAFFALLFVSGIGMYAGMGMLLVLICIFGGVGWVFCRVRDAAAYLFGWPVRSARQKPDGTAAAIMEFLRGIHNRFCPIIEVGA